MLFTFLMVVVLALGIGTMLGVGTGIYRIVADASAARRLRATSPTPSRGAVDTAYPDVRPCKRCGRDAAIGARFCVECGTAWPTGRDA